MKRTKFLWFVFGILFAYALGAKLEVSTSKAMTIKITRSDTYATFEATNVSDPSRLIHLQREFFGADEVTSAINGNGADVRITG